LLEKIRTLAWFARRPTHYAHAVHLVLRKVAAEEDRPETAARAAAWARARAVAPGEALATLGLLPAPDAPLPEPPADLRAEAERRVAEVPVAMGGAGDLRLLHAAVALSRAARAVETGVAYGWSSLAILAGQAGRADARLVSVDMPYPKRGGERFVGAAVPEALHAGWTLLRMPDRPGIDRAIARLGGAIDLCHYDSDKSLAGRRYAYPKLWAALVPGGVFISDDIQDNWAFREFVEARSLPFAVTESAGKFVGIAVKPR
jgi:hypothetical protein